jgi:mRNA interferase MazF
LPARRGEIYRVEPPGRTGSEQAGPRPYLVIQNDLGNLTAPTTILAAITSQTRRRYPFQVAFTADESGLHDGGLVLCEQIYTTQQSRLSARLGFLGPERMRDVDDALRWSLGLI